jgi:hypothetical protein
MRECGITLLIAGASALFLACAGRPHVRSVPFGSFPSQPPDHEVSLYSTKMPECPYEEVGLVSGERRGLGASDEQVLAAVIRQARKMGGDAIVGIGQVRHVSGGGQSVSVDTMPLSGTVVRFTDPHCRY